MAGRSFVRKKGVVLMALNLMMLADGSVMSARRIHAPTPFVLRILPVKDFANRDGDRRAGGDCDLTLGPKCGKMTAS